MMMRSILTLAALATASPIETTEHDGSWLASLESTIVGIAAYGSSHNHLFSDLGRSGGCPLNSAQIPTISSSSLPSPSGTLMHIAVGRGVQNYTCSTSSPSATPVSIGALASLFDASCVASNPLAPIVALQQPLAAPGTNAITALDSMPLIGHHYFTSSTSPTFNLDTPVSGNLGYVATSKKASASAPANAAAGPDGSGHGAVAWLQLMRNTAAPVADAKQATFSEVYRVTTAGGSPPATCDGMDAAFSVQYAAEYWFYS